MMVYFALAERRGFLLDQYNPELIAAVDEGTVEDNPGCYDEQIERARGLLGRRHVGGPGLRGGGARLADPGRVRGDGRAGRPAGRRGRVVTAATECRVTFDADGFIASWCAAPAGAPRPPGVTVLPMERLRQELKRLADNPQDPWIVGGAS